MSGFGVKVDIVGSIAEQMTAGEKELAADITGAMKDASLILKNNWRAQIVGAGLSSRLSNTVRSEVYPKFQNSMGPAALISVKGRSPNRLLAELEDGQVINTAKGRFLAVPTENVPKGPRGIKLSPNALQALTGFKLRFAQNRRGTKMLVSDTVTAKSGRGFRPATRGRLKQGRTATVTVMYILVPQVEIKKRLDLMAAADRVRDELGELLAARIS